MLWLSQCVWPPDWPPDWLADYLTNCRALAERARINYITQSRSRNEPKLLQEFMNVRACMARSLVISVAHSYNRGSPHIARWIRTLGQHAGELETQHQGRHCTRCHAGLCVLHSQSVKYLQADRPYFLPPIVPRHGLRRPPKQVSSTMDGLFNFPLQVAKLTAVAGSSEILLAPFPLVL